MHSGWYSAGVPLVLKVTFFISTPNCTPFSFFRVLYLSYPLLSMFWICLDENHPKSMHIFKLLPSPHPTQTPSTCSPLLVELSSWDNKSIISINYSLHPIAIRLWSTPGCLQPCLCRIRSYYGEQISTSLSPNEHILIPISQCQAAAFDPGDASSFWRPPTPLAPLNDLLSCSSLSF